MTESILKKLIKITEHSTKVSDRLQVDALIPPAREIDENEICYNVAGFLVKERDLLRQIAR